MATMYCALCGRPVEARRHIGAGTWALAVLTAGMSLLAIPFYRKRCSICKSTAVHLSPPGTAGDNRSLLARVGELEQRLALAEGELEAAGVDLSRLKAERDFYKQLLDNPASRARGPTSE